MVKVGSVVCVDFVLGGTCARILVGGGVLGFFLLLFFCFLFFPSDRQDSVRRYILVCLWASCQ